MRPSGSARLKTKLPMPSSNSFAGTRASWIGELTVAAICNAIAPASPGWLPRMACLRLRAKYFWYCLSCLDMTLSLQQVYSKAVQRFRNAVVTQWWVNLL